jgi:hypothetical protein
MLFYIQWLPVSGVGSEVRIYKNVLHKSLLGMQLDIDKQLHQRLSERAEKMGFDSTEEYCVTILETVINELEEENANNEVQSRLEDLGYLE